LKTQEISCTYVEKEKWSSTGFFTVQVFFRSFHCSPVFSFKSSK
jgi:hypothetical protein